MKTLKTGLRFSLDGLVYASDLYASGLSLTLVANKLGYVGDTNENRAAVMQALAPDVCYVSVQFGDTYRKFHREWNFEVPEELLDAPVLLVLR